MSLIQTKYIRLIIEKISDSPAKSYIKLIQASALPVVDEEIRETSCNSLDISTCPALALKVSQRLNKVKCCSKDKVSMDSTLIKLLAEYFEQHTEHMEEAAAKLIERESLFADKAKLGNLYSVQNWCI